MRRCKYMTAGKAQVPALDMEAPAAFVFSKNLSFASSLSSMLAGF